MQSNGSYSTLSPVVYGDIAPSLNTNTRTHIHTGHLNFKHFPEFHPPLKNLSFTKFPSLKETLKTHLNFKEAKVLP